MDALFFNNDKFTLYGFDGLPDDKPICVKLLDRMIIIKAAGTLKEDENCLFFDSIKDSRFKELLMEEFEGCQEKLIIFVEIGMVYYYYFNIILDTEGAKRILNLYDRQKIEILRRDL